MAFAARPKRIPRDTTPDWPVDLDRVVRTHRLRNRAHSAARVMWMLAEALRTLGYDVQAMIAPVHLSQHELRAVHDPVAMPPIIRGREVSSAVLMWGNRIWGLDGSQSWQEVLENGHAHLVDSVWDTSKNFLFRTLFSKGATPIGPPKSPRNYQPLLEALVKTMKEQGLRAGTPLPAPLPPPALPHLDQHQVRHWFEQGEATQPLALSDVFEVQAGGVRTPAVWTRLDEGSATHPLPMGIFHWPARALQIQAFFKHCQMEEALPAPPLAVTTPSRLRM